MPITVSIVDDNLGMRESISALLNGAPGLSCGGAYASGEEAVDAMPRQTPDVALIDMNLPGMNGIECVARLKEKLPNLQILMLSLYEQNDLVFDSIRVGASGYLLKSTSADELLQAIEQVHAGGAPMSMQIARKVVDHFRRLQQPAATPEVEHLTPREQEVLELLAKGYYYREIADHLSVSMSTVRAHLHTIYHKLHVRSRTEAVSRFLR